MNLEVIIMPLVAILYGLVEIVKWVKKGQKSDQQQDNFKDHRLIIMDRLRKIEENIDERTKQHMDVMLILRDVTHMLQDITHSQRELAKAQTDLAKILGGLQAK